MKKALLIFSILFMSMPLLGQFSLAQYQAPYYTSGLILNLDAANYSGTGTTWNDLSNQSNIATLIGSPSYNSTAFFSFNANKYATTAKSTISLTNATFIAWVNPSQNQADFTGVVFNRSTFGGSNAPATGLNFNRNSVGYHWNGTSSSFEWVSGLTVPNNIWSMMAVTVNSNVATAYLYNLNAASSATNNNQIHSALTGLNFYIATDPGYTDRTFMGNIGKVMVYNRALTQTEIQTLYNEQKYKFGLLKTCKEILTFYPQATSGVYLIDPDGSGSQASTNCYCDMTTDGGGWTLVLNYLHKGGTNPNLIVTTSSLPLLGSTSLGTDESSSSTTWGHVSNSYLTSFPFTELRFYGKTSAHTRIIHYKTSHTNTINYFKTGSGSMTGIASSFTALTGHTANLPASTTDYFTSQGNNAMTNFPYWKVSVSHWGIKGADFRWEVDDFANDSSKDTFHQIWIR